jgi:adenosine deaminase CECR1
VRWSVFEDQNAEDWLQGIEEGAYGKRIRAKRMQQWHKEWEQFCEWIVAEFGESGER